jgi:acetoin:2,6-dichlorophenolindophenol oxidoreductase subunit alpha
VPRFRCVLVQDGTLSAEQADRIAGDVRDEMQAAVEFGLDSPFPEPEAATNFVYA